MSILSITKPKQIEARVRFECLGRWQLDEEVTKSKASLTEELLSEWDRDDGDCEIVLTSSMS